MITNLHIIILGLGRFGSLWLRCMQNFGQVQAYDPQPDIEALLQSHNPARIQESLIPERKALDEALQHCDVLFFCVPISAMQSVLAELQTPLLHRLRSTLDTHSPIKPLWLMDTCSVKMQPMEYLRQMQKKLLHKTTLQSRASELQAAFRILGLHPMFGPDSFRPHLADSDPSVRNLEQNPLRLVLCPEKDNLHSDEILLWEQRFAALGLSPVVMSAQEHDREAARTQGLTHLLGRVLDAFGVCESPISTIGYQALCQICEQTCHDSWQLFLDIQQQNSYTPLMRQEFQRALETVYDALETNGNIKKLIP